MSNLFTPRTDILPAPQQKLWTELGDIPAGFTLYGGTAVALHLGHRQSVDFDFFSHDHFDPDTILDTVSFMKKAQILQKSANTLTALIDRNGPVQISFFGVPKLKRLRPTYLVPENNIRIADLLDLSGTKVAVVQKRAEAKDYIDIDALITQGKIDLALALSAGCVLYGDTFNPEITLKALCYFEDGNVAQIPPDMRARLAKAILSVNLDQLPPLSIEGDK